MKITNISVRASRTLPHPNLDYANYKADIELHASLDDGDDPAKVAVHLQHQAESLVEQHCAELRGSIDNFHRVVEARQQIPKLESQIESLQKQLDGKKHEVGQTMFGFVNCDSKPELRGQ